MAFRVVLELQTIDGVVEEHAEVYALLAREVARFNAEGDDLLAAVFGPLRGEGPYFIPVRAVTGRPAPYDAWTGTHDGRFAIFFNLSQWTPERIARSALPIIKHEVSHALLEPLLPRPRNPLEELDRIVIDEGLAHFIGFPGDPADILGVHGDSGVRAETELAEARRELADPACDEAKAASILERAATGDYWSKYGAIAGMAHAAKLFRNAGPEALVDWVQLARGSVFQ